MVPVSQSTSGEATLLDWTIAMDPTAGRLEADAVAEESNLSRILDRKVQGLVGGRVQAAILVGGQLEVDKGGFHITFNGAFPPLPLNRGIDSE